MVIKFFRSSEKQRIVTEHNTHLGDEYQESHNFYYSSRNLCYQLKDNLHNDTTYILIVQNYT